MSYYIGVDNKQHDIDWDLVFINKNKNINGKYIISIVEYHNCIDNYFEFYFLLEQCIDFVNKFGIYKTISMVAVYHCEIITFNQLKNNNLLYIRLAKLLLQHLSSFDIIANSGNCGYIPIDTLDDDTISNASTEINDSDSDTDTDTDTDTESDSDSESDTDTDTDTESDSESESDTDTDTDTESDSESESDTDSDSDYESNSASDTDSDTDTESDDDTDSDTESDSDDECYTNTKK